jgi:peptide/nickel transport system substrate-binding protein
LRKIIPSITCVLLASAIFLAACSKPADNQADVTKSTEKPVQSDNKASNTSTPVKPTLGFIKASNPSSVPAASKKRTDTMIIGTTEPQGIFSPWFYSTSYDGYVMTPIFEGLGKYSQDASIVPNLATWDTSGDGLTYTFHIDPKAKFSDGTPVTAEDAAFGFYVYLDPKYDGRSDLTVPKIVGTNAYKKGDAQTIDGIKVVDERTLQITVEEARANTLDYLAVTSVLPKKYYGKNFKKGDLTYVKSLNGKPLGSGPYTFKEFIPGQEVRMVANENYWRGTIAKVKNLIFKATTKETYIQLLQTGETDFEEGITVSKDNVELLKSMGFVDVNMLLNNGYGYIAINNKLPKFQDKRVRQALTYGLNREDIVEAYANGYAQVIDVPQSKLSWAYPDESKVTHYTFNPGKAKQLLDEAGWKTGPDGYRYKDGEKFTIHFSASTPNAVNDALIPIAVANYKDLGIEFIPEQLEFNAVIDKRNKGNHEMAFLAWSLTPDPDPYGTFHTKGGNNKDSYSNPEIDKLIEASQKELNKDKRKEMLNKIYQLLNDDMPNIFVYQRYNMNVINARLKGFDITPYYSFANSLHQVEIIN